MTDRYLGMVIESPEDLFQLREAIRDILTTYDDYVDLLAVLDVYVSYVSPKLCLSNASHARGKEAQRLHMGRWCCSSRQSTRWDLS